MRNDHRGITFVELLIAMAVSVIIMGAATLFLSSAHKSYNNASNAIDLQSESQVLMEQIGMWVMEGNRVEVNGNKLIIYQIPRKVTTPLPDGVPPKTDTTNKRIIWLSGNKLYMKNITGIINFPTNDPDVDASDEDVSNLIGEYVTAFSPAKSSDSAVTVSVEMKAGKQKYEIKNEFKVRNVLR